MTAMGPDSRFPRRRATVERRKGFGQGNGHAHETGRSTAGFHGVSKHPHEGATTPPDAGRLRGERDAYS